MGKSSRKPERSATSDGILESRLRMSRQVYADVQRQFGLHDAANESLERKAQHLMIASALVASLFTSVTLSGEVGRLLWGLEGLYMAAFHTAGMVLAIVLCTRVNRASSHPAPIVGDALLCHGKLDENAYKDLVEDEECYYKNRIEDHALALVALKRTNEAKAKMLARATVAFIVSLGALIPGIAVLQLG